MRKLGMVVLSLFLSGVGAAAAFAGASPPIKRGPWMM